MTHKYLLFIITIVLLSACDYDYYDYNYDNYTYTQVVRFGDTNRIIKEVNYFEGSLIDSPNSSASNLRVSPNENTRFVVSDGNKKYSFEVKMKFKMEEESDEYAEPTFIKKYEGIELLKSTASKVRINRSENYKSGSQYNYYRTINFIDSLIIE